jgi:hypothetical protein
MASYSVKIVQLNAAADGELLGVQLGRLCIHMEIPVAHVADHLDVTKTTVYKWFLGRSQVSKHLTRAVLDICRDLTDPAGPPGYLVPRP